MNAGLVIGTIIMAGGLGFMIYLILKSRNTIEFIHKNKLKSLREIQKRLHERR